MSEALSISSSRIAEIVDLGSRSNYNIPLLLVPGKSQGGAVMLMLMIALSAYKDGKPVLKPRVMSSWGKEKERPIFTEKKERVAARCPYNIIR